MIKNFEGRRFKENICEESDIGVWSALCEAGRLLRHHDWAHAVDSEAASATELCPKEMLTEKQVKL